MKFSGYVLPWRGSALTECSCGFYIFRLHSEGIGKHVQSLHSQSPPTHTPYGSSWAPKIADIFFLPYIAFIIDFTALESIPHIKSLHTQSGLPPEPLLWVKLGS